MGDEATRLQRDERRMDISLNVRVIEEDRHERGKKRGARRLIVSWRMEKVNWYVMISAIIFVCGGGERVDIIRDLFPLSIGEATS